MLPTSGYFKGLSCPYFANGLCERPHCHFRHLKTDASELPDPQDAVVVEPVAVPSSTPATLPQEQSFSEDKPDLLKLVREAILQVQKEVESADVVNLQTLSQSLGGVTTNNPDKHVVGSFTTPSSDCRAISKKKTAFHVMPAVVAEYKPTPISHLKKLRAANEKKKTTTTTNKPHSESLEYVPTSITPKNKTTESKSSSTRSVVPDVLINKSSSSSSNKYLLSDSEVTTEAKFSSDSDSVDFSSDNEIGAAISEDKGVVDVNKSSRKSLPYVPAAKPATPSRTKKKAKSDGEAYVPTKPNSATPSLAIKAKKCKPSATVNTNVKVKAESKSGVAVAAAKQKSKAEGSKEKVTTKDKRVEKKQDDKLSSSATNEKRNSVPKLSPSSKKTKTLTNGKESSSSISSKKKSTTTKSPGRNEVDGKGSGGKLKCATSNHLVASLPNLPAKTEPGSKPPDELEMLNLGDILSGEDDEYKLDFVDFDDDDDDDDTYEECLQIFNEYVPDNVTPPPASKFVDKVMPQDEEIVIPGKKRVAHNQNHGMKRPPPTQRHHLSASEVMFQRFSRVQQMMKEKQEKNASDDVSDSLHQSPSSVKKPRIAHIPRASSGLETKSASTSRQDLASSGVAALPDGGENKRIAHVPKMVTSMRPTIPPEYGSKVPIGIRQRYLNFIIDECLKIYDCDKDAFERGVAEEKNSYGRSSNRTVYLNVVANTIKKLRNEQSTKETSKKGGSGLLIPGGVKERRSSSSSEGGSKTLSHEFVLGGKKAASVSYSIERTKPKSLGATLSGVTLYHLTKKYILTKDQLIVHGFPLPHPTDPGRALINRDTRQTAKHGHSNDPTEKVCCRCGSTFRVSNLGVYEMKEECFYHWGRAYKVRAAGAYETRYSCCQGGTHSEGCCVGKLHVFEDVSANSLRGFVRTLQKSPRQDNGYGVFALDCEMCYTHGGIELVRITVIGPDLKSVYETLVKPEKPVIDYNTRFSGIAEGDLSGVKTSLRDVQAVLLNMFSEKTILIGHSLESDLKALKLIHPTVVDTSVVFPHKLGLPYKRALRSLVGEYLKKIIQNSVDGHDSREDALACMELMLWKAKEDLK